MKKPPGLDGLKHNFYKGGESESQIMFYTLQHLANECQPSGK